MPTVEFFKSLPTIQRTDSLWGVYVLVLERSGEKPFIYVDSGTAGNVSIYARLHQYDNLMKTREWFSGIPKFMCDKTEYGWGVTHKGVLVSSPLPSKSEQLLLRALMLLMETLFTIIFWAIRSIKDRASCPWDLQQLFFGGLRTHFAIMAVHHYQQGL
ncbi:hypothetical protein H9Q74_005582 [Fusarium xylarioides]|nr:hypothetical protein H9Q71_007762 [Fusarium xylarioides]KAG5824326.1 hypothetical protein H9Q74_005582 [Fusarium xylarioides]